MFAFQFEIIIYKIISNLAKPFCWAFVIDTLKKDPATDDGDKVISFSSLDVNYPVNCTTSQKPTKLKSLAKKVMLVISLSCWGDYVELFSFKAQNIISAPQFFCDTILR